ncbi:MAG: DNA-directed RNA polymerase subunit omega [Nitrospira sp.]|nr:DNA-directed RNA polymerase subunit omega [Nitrospira sp.]
MIDPLSLLPDMNQTRFDSRHRLVLVASQRAKHLMQGARPIAPSRFTKETTTAIDEVLHGQIEFLTGKEARQAIKEAKRGKDTEVERMVMVGAGEDAREIKKELSVYIDDSPKPAAEAEGEE